MSEHYNTSELPSTIIDWAVYKSEKTKMQLSPLETETGFTGKNKRRSPRTHVQISVKVWLDCGVVLEGCATDISLTGLSFTCSNYLPVGNPVRIEIHSTELTPPLGFKLAGNIARIHEDGLAVEFTRLKPEQLIALDMLISSSPSLAKKTPDFCKKPFSPLP